ncbi:MAG: hypothetical protein APR54_02060 [Candidatus Cloacimonas sp. SDB]|nr:MAG: hypothetical protein APR54_02060 [Candidatus Cloacimonas sp. SDB]
MESNIGQYLNSVRNEKNLTLEEVSEITKIKPRILKTIEENKFDDLGGLGYTKALLVTYSKAIDADESKVLKMLDETTKGIQVKFSRPSPYKPRKKYQFHMNLIYFIILLVVIAVLTFFIIKLNDQGKLSSPLFKIFSGEKTETKEILQDSLDVQEEEPSEVDNEANLNQKALFDTSNYTADLLFEGKESPLKYNE